MKLILTSLLLTSCGLSQVQRQSCLAKAELEANNRSDRECINAGYSWDECPTHDSIMSELKSAQERCR